MEAGRTEIPLQRTRVENVRLHKGVRMGIKGPNWSQELSMERVPEEEIVGPSVGAVDEVVPEERVKDPPEPVMNGLNPEQRVDYK